MEYIIDLMSIAIGCLIGYCTFLFKKNRILKQEKMKPKENISEWKRFKEELPPEDTKIIVYASLEGISYRNNYEEIKGHAVCKWNIKNGLKPLFSDYEIKEPYYWRHLDTPEQELKKQLKDKLREIFCSKEDD